MSIVKFALDDGAAPADLPAETTGSVHEPRAAPPQRESWPDFARACAIVLVVLYHSRHTTWIMGFHDDGPADRVWALISDVLMPLRMPLFFVISGMFAARAIDRPWAQVAVRRVWNSLYLYVLWAVIYLLAIPAWPTLGRSAFTLPQQIGMIVIGDTPAWYLWALVVFFLFARATARLPAVLVLGIGFVGALVGPSLTGVLHNPPRLALQCLFFFMLGARFSPIPMKIARAATPLRLLASTALMLVLLAAYHVKVPGIFPFAGMAAVLWGITATSLATRHFAVLRGAGGWLGSRTLPIYVMHFVVLTLLLNLLAAILPESLKGFLPLALIAPVLVCIVTLLICLPLAALLPRIGLGWLLKMPQPKAA